MGGSSISLKCSCLAILVNDSDPEECGLDAVSRFQLYFGRLKKQQKQLKLINWIRYAEANITGVNKMPYFLPYIVDGEEILEEATETYSNLATHKICQGTMMDVLGRAGCDFLKTCRLCVETNQLHIHGLVGKVSVKRKRFEEGEEPALIDFFRVFRGLLSPWQHNLCARKLVI
jgi:hypothetical protein